MQRKIKLLIVEDDPVQSVLIKESLGYEKYDVFEIPDGREALDYLLNAASLPDLILMDYHLPTMDGLTILEELKRSKRKHNIVFLTADYSIETALKSINAGALEFIPKDARYLLNIGTIVQKAYQAVRADAEMEQIEKALKDSEARFKTVIEATKDGIFEWNRKTGIIYPSPNNAIMLGYEPSEFPIKHDDFIALVHPDDRDTISQKLAQNVLPGTTLYEAEIRIKSKNGLYKWILERGIIVENDKEGKPLRVIGTHTDISERKAAQQKIIEANDRLTTLIGNLPGIVYRCKLSNPIEKEFVGGRVFEITGYSDEELLKHDASACFFLIHPNDKTSAFEIINKAIELKSGYEQYYRIICKNGQIKWVWDHGKVVENKNAGASYIEGYIADVTEKIESEKALKQSEEEKNTILDNSMHAFLLLSPKGIIIDFNRVANHRTIIVSGTTLKKNLPVFEFLPGNEKQVFQKLFKKVIQGEPAYWEQAVEQRGTITWFENVLVPVLISRNEIKYVCYTSTDITERKIAEDKILASENLYNSTINSLNEYLMVVDNNSRLLLANEALQRYLGKKNKLIKITGKNIKEVLPLTGETIFHYLNDVFIKQQEITIEEPFIWDGKAGIAEIKISPITVGDNVVRAIIVVRDITERKNFEKRIMNAIIETEERERKRFSEDLHDEMGSILSALKIYVNSIVDPNIPEEKKLDITSLANQLIDQAIQTSKEIANNLSPNVIMRFGLMSALYSQCEKLQLSSGFEIVLNDENYKHELQKEEEISIYRIITELINNSVKYSGGKRIEVNFSSTNNSLIISYNDNGKGFDFKKVLSSGKGGLGLQNIQSRLTSLNGSFISESGEFGGFFIRFDLKIPLAKI